MATLAQIQLQVVSDTRGAEEGLRRIARAAQMVQSARDRMLRGGTVDVKEITRVADELQRVAQGYQVSSRAVASGAQRVTVAMQQKAAATRQAGAQIREVVTIMDTMTARFSRVLELVAEFGLALAAWGAVQTAIGGVAHAAVQLNAKLEQTTVAWTALTGSQEKARLIIEQINLIAAKTPFYFEQLLPVFQRLALVGVPLEHLPKVVSDIATAVTAVGGGAEEIDRVTIALQQMLAFGLVRAEEMRQLVNAGIPAWQILANVLNTDVAGAMRAVEERSVTAQQFLQGLSQWVQSLGGIMEAQARTFTGAWTTITDAVSIAIATGFRPLFDAMRESAIAVMEFVTSDRFLIDWAATLHAVVELVVDGLGYLRDAFLGALTDILSIASAVGQAIYDALQWLNPFARHSPSLVESVDEGMGEIADAFAQSEEQIRDAVAGIRAQIRALQAQLRSLQAVERQLSAELREQRRILDQYRDALRGVQDRISEVERRIRALRDATLVEELPFLEALEQYDRRIKELRLQKLQLEFAGAPIAFLDLIQEEIDILQKRAEMIDLQRDLEVGPLRDQLERAADAALGLNEAISFGEAIAEIQALTQELVALRQQEQYWLEQVAQQEQVVAALEEQLDALRTAMDELRNAIAELQNQLSQYQTQLDRVKDQNEEQRKRIYAVGDAFAALRQRVEEVATTPFTVDLSGLAQLEERSRRAAEEFAEAFRRAGQVVPEIAGRSAEEIVRVADELLRAAREGRTFAGSLEEMRDRASDFQGALEDARSALREQQDVLAEYERLLRDVERALRDTERAIRGLVEVPLVEEQPYLEQLKELEKQIQQLEYQRISLILAGAPDEQIEAVEEQIRQLQLQAKKVDLEREMKIGPMREQLQEMADTALGTNQALTFQDALRAMQAHIENYKTLQEQQRQLNQLVEDQTALVDEWKRRVEALEEVYEGLQRQIREVSEAQRKATDEAPSVEMQWPEPPGDWLEDARKRAEQFDRALQNARTTLSSWIEPYLPAIKTGLQLLGEYAAVAAVMLPIWLAVAGAQKLFGGYVLAVANAITAAKIALAPVVLTLLPSFMNGLALLGGAAGAAQRAIGGLGGALAVGTWHAFTTAVRAAWQALLLLANPFQLIVATFQALKAVATPVVGVLLGLWRAITLAAGVLVDFTLGLWKLGEGLYKVWSGAKKAAAAAAAVTSTVAAAGGAFQQLVKAAGSVSRLMQAMQVLRDVLAGVKGALLGAATTVHKALGALSALASGAAGGVRALWQSLRGVAGAALVLVRTDLAGPFQAFTRALAGAASAAQRTGQIFAIGVRGIVDILRYGRQANGLLVAIGASFRMLGLMVSYAWRALNPFGTVWNVLASGARLVVAAVAEFFVLLSTGVRWVWNAIGGLQGLIGVLQRLWGAVLAVGGGIKTVFPRLMQTMQVLRDVLAGVKGALLGAAAAVHKALGALSALASGAAGGVRALWQSLRGVAGAALVLVRTDLAGPFQAFTRALAGAASAAQRTGQIFAIGVRGIVDILRYGRQANGLLVAIGASFRMLGLMVSYAWRALNPFGTVWNVLASGARLVVAAVAEFFVLLSTGVRWVWNAIGGLQGLIGALQRLWGAVLAAGSDIKTVLQAAFGGVAGAAHGVGSVLGSVWSAIQRGFTTVKNLVLGIPKAFEAIKNVVSGVLQPLLKFGDEVVRFFGKIWQVIGPGVQFFVSGFQKFVALLTGAGALVGKVFGLFQAGAGAVTTLAGALGPLVGFVTRLLNPTTALSAALMVLKGGFLSVKAPIVAVKALLTGMFGGFWGLINLAFLLYEAFKSNWFGIRDIVLPVIEAIWGAFQRIQQAFQQGGLAAGIQTAVTEIQGLVPVILGAVGQLAQNIWTAIQGVDWGAVWNALVQGFTAAVTGIWNALVNLVTRAWQFIQDTDWSAVFSAIGDAIANAFSAIWNTLSTVGTAIWNALQQVDWQQVAQTAIDFLGAAWETVSGLAERFFNWLSTTLGQVDWGAVANTAIDLLLAYWETLVGVGGRILNWLLGVLGGIDWQQVANTVVDGLIAAWELVTDVAGRIFGWLEKTFNQVDWGKVGQTVLDALIGAITAITDAGTRLASFLYEELDKAIDLEDFTSIGNKILDKIKQAFTPEAIAGAFGALATAVAPAPETGDQQGQLGVLDQVRQKIADIAAAISAFASNPAVQMVAQIVGGVLGTAWNALVAGAKDLVTVFRDELGPLWQQLKETLSALAPILGVVAAVIGGVLLAALWTLAQVISIVVPTAFQLALTIIQVFLAIVETVANVVVGVVKIVWAVMTGDWQRAWEEAKNLVSNLVENIKGIVWTIVDFFVDFGQRIWDKITAAWQKIYDWLVGGSLIPDLVNKVKEWFDKAKEFITKPIEDVWNFLTSKWESIKNTVTTKAQEIATAIDEKWNGIKNTVTNVVSTIWTELQTKWEEIKTTVTTKVNELWTKIQEIWNNIKTTILEKVTNIKTEAERLWGEFRTNLQTFMDEAKTKFFEIWDAIVRKVEETKQSLASALKWPFEQLRDAMDGIMRKAHEFFRGGANALIRGINAVGSGLVTALRWIGEKLSISWLQGLTWTNLAEIPAYARGTDRHPGGVALVGEEGPELVVLPEGAQVLPHDVTQRILAQRVDAPGMVFGGLMDVVGNIVGSIGSMLESVAETVLDWASKGAQWVVEQALRLPVLGDLAGAWLDVVTSLFTLVKNELTNFVQALLDALKPKAEEAIDKWVLPLPRGSYVVSQEFGWTEYARSGAYGGAPHTGIDLAAARGTPVYAARGGHVDVAGWWGGYGIAVMLSHANNLSTIYGHLLDTLVAVGETVRAGQQIGYVDSTGYSTGDHLHFEIREGGVPVNPRKYLAFAAGGLLREPVVGVGTRTGLGYLLAERGPELVIPATEPAGGEIRVEVHVHGDVVVENGDPKTAQEVVERIGYLVAQELRRRGLR